MAEVKGIDLAMVLELHSRGWLAQEIADKLGCSRQNVQQRLARRVRPKRPQDPNPGWAGRGHKGSQKRDPVGDYIPRQAEVDEAFWIEEPGECGHEETAYHSNCRGAHCREGKQAYWAARQAAVKAGAASVGTHGVSGYRQGCRCNACRAAVRERRARERKARVGA